MSRFNVPGPDPATLSLESSAKTPLFLRSDGRSGEKPSAKSITRSRDLHCRDIRCLMVRILGQDRPLSRGGGGPCFSGHPLGFR